MAQESQKDVNSYDETGATAEAERTHLFHEQGESG
jgi:hypothetical protein